MYISTSGQGDGGAEGLNPPPTPLPALLWQPSCPCHFRSQDSHSPLLAVLSINFKQTTTNATFKLHSHYRGRGIPDPLNISPRSGLRRPYWLTTLPPSISWLQRRVISVYNGRTSEACWSMSPSWNSRLMTCRSDSLLIWTRDASMTTVQPVLFCRVMSHLPVSSRSLTISNWPFDIA